MFLCPIKLLTDSLVVFFLSQSCRGTSPPRAVRNTQTGFKRKRIYLRGKKYNQCH